MTSMPPNPYHIFEGIRDGTRTPQTDAERELAVLLTQGPAHVSQEMRRAYELFQDNFRHMVNAALFAHKVTLDEIAECFGVEIEVIELYMAVFFDVRTLAGADQSHRYLAWLSNDHPGIASLFEDVRQLGLQRIRFLLEPGYCLDSEELVYNQLAHAALSRLRNFEFSRLTNPHLRMNKELLADRKFVTDWVKHRQKLNEKTSGSGGVAELRIYLKDVASIATAEEFEQLGAEGPDDDEE